MNFKMIGRLHSWILAAEAVFMLPSVVIGLGYGEYRTAGSFAMTIGIILAVAALFALLCRNAKRDLRAKEGLVCVGTSWILMSVLGCLPFVIGGEIPNYADALFETVSGFTTTGASIVPDVEALTHASLYWRSFTHWIGGMGVLVFLLAIVPLNGKNEGYTMHLLRAESPGPDVGKLVPRMRTTAAVLYLTYVGLTMLNFLFLVFDMPVFDAVCTALGTAGTGGFGIKADSLAGYSPYVQNVCTVFMFLFGVNFACYYLILLRRFRSVLADEELRLYLGIAVGSILLITCNLWAVGTYRTVGETVRHAAFQVSSIMTTTGYATTNFDLWPSFSKSILLGLMVVGACAGSTGGGIKCSRILLLFKGLRRNISKLMHPDRVQAVRVNDKVVDEGILANTGAYLSAYVVIIAVSFVLISLDGFSLMTNFSAVLACFNNIGPGFEMVGPVGNFASFGVFSKLVLIFDMLAGRLEIFPILILLSRNAWKKY